MEKQPLLRVFTEKDFEKRRAKTTPTKIRNKSLAWRSIWVLQVLWKRQAFDDAHRLTTREIAVNVSKRQKRKADPNQYLRVVSDLRKLGLVETKEGRGGGCWLTAAGKKRAKLL